MGVIGNLPFGNWTLNPTEVTWMLTSIQFTLQDLFWDYLVLELSLLGLILDNVYYSGDWKTFWLVDLWAYSVYIYTLAGLVTTFTLEDSSVLECQVVCCKLANCCHTGLSRLWLSPVFWTCQTPVTGLWDRWKLAVGQLLVLDPRDQNFLTGSDVTSLNLTTTAGRKLLLTSWFWELQIGRGHFGCYHNLHCFEICPQLLSQLIRHLSVDY